jgi:membrane-associated phospholipid phosphatase
MPGSRLDPSPGERPAWPGRASSGERFFARPSLALTVGGGLVALVVVLGLLIPGGPLNVDQRWSELMGDMRTEALDRLARVFNSLGRGLGVVVLAAIGLVLARVRRWWALLAFAAAEGLTSLANALAKHLVERARPPDGLLHPHGSSFPSGHAAHAGATTVALVLLLTRPGRHRRIWWALALLGTAGMAWSRTYLQVHWLTDVVAGSLLGIGIALLTFAIAQLGRERATPPDRDGP